VGSRSRGGMVQAAAGVGAVQYGQQQEQEQHSAGSSRRNGAVWAAVGGAAQHGQEPTIVGLLKCRSCW